MSRTFRVRSFFTVNPGARAFQFKSKRDGADGFFVILEQLPEDKSRVTILTDSPNLSMGETWALRELLKWVLRFDVCSHWKKQRLTVLKKEKEAAERAYWEEFFSNPKGVRQRVEDHLNKTTRDYWFAVLHKDKDGF